MTEVTLLNKQANYYTGTIIKTYLLHDFPKRLLAEFNTHRQLSRNWESSRARPALSVIKQCTDDPYVPDFTVACKGMQGDLIADIERINRARYRYLLARDNAVEQANELIDLGIHKQDVNALLDPWVKVSGIVTATEWDNFFKLRNHKDAHVTFQKFAQKMWDLDQDWKNVNELKIGEWYKPWPDLSIEANVCKAASISYASHDKDRTEEDYKRIYNDLKTANPLHASPFEHCAITTAPGDWINYKYPLDANGERLRGVIDVVDPNDLDGTIETCNISNHVSEPCIKHISTANFKHFLQARKLLELGIDPILDRI